MLEDAFAVLAPPYSEGAEPEGPFSVHSPQSFEGGGADQTAEPRLVFEDAADVNADSTEGYFVTRALHPEAHAAVS